MSLLHTAKRTFYEKGGPWYRTRVFETLGSRRYARPALHGMDRRLEEILPDRPGTFIEAGAHDGFTQSNTYYLERYKSWRGLLVEAMPDLYEKARRRRPGSYVANAAIVGPDFEGDTVAMRFDDLMSTVVAEDNAPTATLTSGRLQYEVEVPARTLSSLLDEAGIDEVDLLSLDVEGHEADALRGLDFDRHAPAFILIEMLDMAHQRPTFDELLGDRYAFDTELSAWDALYRRRAA